MWKAVLDVADIRLENRDLFQVYYFIYCKYILKGFIFVNMFDLILYLIEIIG